MIGPRKRTLRERGEGRGLSSKVFMDVVRKTGKKIAARMPRLGRRPGKRATSIIFIAPLRSRAGWSQADSRLPAVPAGAGSALVRFERHEAAAQPCGCRAECRGEEFPFQDGLFRGTNRAQENCGDMLHRGNNTKTPV